MKLKLSWILFISIFLFAATASSQQLKIISSIDHTPLPYATVTNHSHPSLISANIDGIARPVAAIGDSLSVSYVGYKTAFIRFDGSQLMVVTLVREKVILPPVTIRNCAKTREFTMKNYETVKKKKDQQETKGFSAVIWSNNWNTNGKIAVRLRPQQPGAVLKSFSFWIEKDEAGPDSAIRTPLLLSFYEVSDSTLLPGDAISNAPVIFFPKKGGKQTLHLDSLHLSIPANGIYVSIQYVMNEQYQWIEKTKWRYETDSVLRDTMITRYGGKIIAGVRSRDFEFVNYYGLKGEWHTIRDYPLPLAEPRTTIKCEAVVRYCYGE